jgi:hypothetical protein
MVAIIIVITMTVRIMLIKIQGNTNAKVNKNT